MGGYDARLSEGFIAFEGLPIDSDVFPKEHPIYFHDIAKRQTHDTGYRGGLACFVYPHLILYQYESWHGDLNEDGDEIDKMRVVYDVNKRTGFVFDETARLTLPCVSTGHISYYRIEPYDGIDYNDDGDYYDRVVFLYDIENRSEIQLGEGSTSRMYGRFAVWGCRHNDENDICYRDVLNGSQRLAGISSNYPGGRADWFYGDSDLLVFSLRHGEQKWLAFLNMATGDLVVDKGVGVVSSVSLRVSEGQIFACTGYPLPHSCYIYDTSTGETQDLSRDSRGLYYLQFSSGMVLFNDHSGAYIPEGPPPPLPNVMIYDPNSGEESDTGLDGYLLEYGAFDGYTIVISSDEGFVKEDVNQDGDFADPIIVYSTSIGTSGNPELLFLTFAVLLVVGSATLVGVIAVNRLLSKFPKK